MAKKRALKRAPTTPAAGTPAYPKWKKSISAGMATGRERRREEGLLTKVETAVVFLVPAGFVQKAVKLRKLPVIEVGKKQYIRREDAEAFFGKRRTA